MANYFIHTGPVPPPVPEAPRIPEPTAVLWYQLVDALEREDADVCPVAA